MPLKPGPMRVVHGFHSSKEEVLDDITKLDLWPTVYVSERMQGLPLHWHDVENCGYVMEETNYVLDSNGSRIELSAGDKLVPCTPKGKWSKKLFISSEFLGPKTSWTRFCH